MTDEKSDPTDVEFTGEAPDYTTPPDIPDPNMIFYMQAMRTFHKYVLHMFEQFQDDIADVRRRVQMMEFVVNAQNHISVKVATELHRINEMTVEMDDTLLYIQENMLYKPVPIEDVDFSKVVLTNTSQPPT